MSTTTTTTATATITMRRPRSLETVRPKLVNLSYIRNQLIRLEDTILFNLIERSQYPFCRQIYSKPAGYELKADDNATSTPLSWLDKLLYGQERLHARFHRYDALDEMPFFPDAASAEGDNAATTLRTKMLRYFPINSKIREESLHKDSATMCKEHAEGAKAMENWNTINYTDRIRRYYAEEILPRVGCFRDQRDETAGEDPAEVMEDAEEVMGSAALCDIAILQSLSRRIHFGKFVAESKFQSDRKRFEALIRRGDVKAIERAITDEGVEKKVLERLALKAMVYGRDPASGRGRIDVDGVVGLFQDWVIPITKEVEVEYLLRRLDNEFPDLV